MGKMFKSGNYFTLVLLSVFLYSCESYKVEEVYNIGDYPEVTWENPVRAILEENCVPCHNEDVRYGGVRHDVYEIELFLVNDGRLEGVINHLPGYRRMPYQSEQLPPNLLEILNNWIENGAPEN